MPELHLFRGEGRSGFPTTDAALHEPYPCPLLAVTGTAAATAVAAPASQ